MNPADLPILDQLLAEAKRHQMPSESDSKFFEFFSAAQILREYRLSPDEIEFGIVGYDAQKAKKKKGGSDGGLDSVYVLVNNKLIRDVDQALDVALIRDDINFDVIIIQSRTSTGFELKTVLRIADTTKAILDPTRSPTTFSEEYNQQLLEIIRCYRAVHTTLMHKQMTFSVRICYAAKADSSVVHGSLLKKAQELEIEIPRLLTTCNKCEFEFVGARRLIELCRRPEKYECELICEDSISDDNNGYVALVTLGNFYDLITNAGELREGIFDSNVRDYAEAVEVNEQIRKTLENAKDNPKFWWLNNGITILADKVCGTSKRLRLTEPRIVNGLQTSHVIYHYLKPLPDTKDRRHAVIRIIETPDTDLQDQIIRATNSQTKISSAILRASDQLQRDIETEFKTAGMHYDRRKNSWKKTGLPVSKVAGITEMAQSVAAAILNEPDHARARPSRYFKTDQEYDRVFSKDRPPKAYLICVKLKKKAEIFLKTAEKASKDRTNLLFYILSGAINVIRNKKQNPTMPVWEIDVDTITDSVFEEALQIIRPIYIDCGGDDQAAKGKKMVTDLAEEYKKRYGQQKVVTS